jgi:hypothetical protein
VFSIIDGKVFDSPDFFANVMDLVDGVDAAVAGGGDGVSLDCILEVTFSGGLRTLSAARRASSSGHARSALNTES